ncbi:DegT/DnrJ/EryC1/StrS family aminotransferase [Paenibacillus dendritiformis]|uniref:DegT/DnrJ/EryC1/StrS family aminotransferase n=1 Tax=Paenibacillus dendritiformis TaxID=130049 RepID=UPI0030B90A21
MGSWADMTMFSFHPVKHITTGEGGVLTTSNEALYRKLTLFRNHGMTRNAEEWTRNDGPWYYEMHELGGWLPEYFKAGRCEIFESLREEGIGVNVHYIPV